MSYTETLDLRIGARRYRAILKAHLQQFQPRKEKRPPRQSDFFDAAQVTQDDVRAWLIAVPRLDPDSWRAAQYVRAYDVAGKIARAKADGSFHRLTHTRNPTP